MSLVPELSLILPNLYIGTKKIARDRDELQAKGIGHIVNCAKEIRNYFQEHEGFHYMHCPVMDTDLADLSPYFEQASSFIRKAIETGHPVLIHCKQGVSRSATIACAYLIQYEKMSLAEAYRTVKVARSICKPRANFIRQLAQFEQLLSKRERKRLEAVEQKSSLDNNTDVKQVDVDVSASGTKKKRKATEEPVVEEQRTIKEVKRNVVGPARGPSKPSKGPARGPPRGPPIGPSRGPN